ncbi:hypothetical protein H072_2437 [Dactylellina haptotyla CBS 200.50]|uniref:Uncharacterized protein n=1 Tax=Dactylellina haptotyla (strain CBS 200.50) TaxID=1284197 RepID=S8AKT8_DACHA|nr:hypothetical protein H072_2437 [Dactylellina haptotyla CBS 200.50]
MPKVDLKGVRVKRIRSLSAQVLSDLFERDVPASDVSFITTVNKGYNWFLSRTVLNMEMGYEDFEEYGLPEWTKKQMHRWTVNEAYQMIEWLRNDVLKAEIVNDKGERRHKKPKLHHEEPKRFVLEEVRIVVLTEEEKLQEKMKWQQPSVKIKGPASDFIAWMTGAADRDTVTRMEKRYLRGQEPDGGDDEKYNTKDEKIIEDGDIEMILD